MKIVSFDQAENLPPGCQLLDLLPHDVLLEELNVRYLDEETGKLRTSVIDGIIAENGGVLEVFESLSGGKKRCFFNKEELAKMDIRGVSYLLR